MSCEKCANNQSTSFTTNQNASPANIHNQQQQPTILTTSNGGNNFIFDNSLIMKLLKYRDNTF